MWVLVDLSDRELFMIKKRKEILKFKFHSLKKVIYARMLMGYIN